MSLAILQRLPIALFLVPEALERNCFIARFAPTPRYARIEGLRAIESFVEAREGGGVPAAPSAKL